MSNVWDYADIFYGCENMDKEILYIKLIKMIKIYKYLALNLLIIIKINAKLYIMEKNKN